MSQLDEIISNCPRRTALDRRIAPFSGHTGRHDPYFTFTFEGIAKRHPGLPGHADDVVKESTSTWDGYDENVSTCAIITICLYEHQPLRYAPAISTRAILTYKVMLSANSPEREAASAADDWLALARIS